MLKNVIMHEIVVLFVGGIVIAFWVAVIKLLFAAAKYLRKKADTSFEKKSDR